MATQCYAMVRGSTIRVTGLGDRGQVPEPLTYAVSKSLIKVTINEVVEPASNEILRTPEEESRLHFVRAPETIRHKVDIEFLRVDPRLFGLVAGVPLVYSDAGQVFYGESLYGVGPYGGVDENSEVVGFDSGTRNTPSSFALEVWSKLDSASAKARPLGSPFDTTGFDEGVARAAADDCDLRRWGYTLFPHLRGGRLSGFRFANGLVSFNLIGAQTRRLSQWGVGPWDLEGPFERLTEPVSPNVSWRTLIITTAPPAQTDGTQEWTDVLDNGTAANPMPDPGAPLSVDGGGTSTSAYIIDGGRAA